MIAIVASAIIEGVFGRPVSVEVHCASGLPGYTMVGLPDTSCRESRDRVRAAIMSSKLKWPKKRITVSLAPSEIKKHGAGLDLAIALAILVASKQLEPEAIANLGAAGELGLDGSLRSVPGLVSIADAIHSAELVVPLDGAAEAAIVRPSSVRGAHNLREIYDWLKGDGLRPPIVEPKPASAIGRAAPDLADVRGQPTARFALEVAAAGGHHMLMIGPPGAGKTMLATRMAGLLPILDRDDALLCTRIHSVAGLKTPSEGLIRTPPFRAPHHGASFAAMVGGGSSTILPGEVSRAHGGVLFLDELGEFPVAVLEALRAPLEEAEVRISRMAASVTLPARFQLIAAMNPCPCGEGGGTDGRCRCSDAAIARYARRLSAPLVDRFDLRIDVDPPDRMMLLGGPKEEGTEQVKERVQAARNLARTRGVRVNAELPAAELDHFAPLTPGARKILERALQKGELTGRGLRRIRTVARTIADLAGVSDGSSGSEGAIAAVAPVGETAIAQALSLRVQPLRALRGAA